LDPDHAGPAVRGREAPVSEEAFRSGAARPHRPGPLERLQSLVVGGAKASKGPYVEDASAIVLEPRKRCMLAEDVDRSPIAERRPEPHPAGGFAYDPPVGASLAGCHAERPLPRDPAFRIGDGAVLLTPRRGRQPDMRIA